MARFNPNPWPVGEETFFFLVCYVSQLSVLPRRSNWRVFLIHKHWFRFTFTGIGVNPRFLIHKHWWLASSWLERSGPARARRTLARPRPRRTSTLPLTLTSARPPARAWEVARTVVAPPSSVVQCLWKVFVWGVGVLFLSCVCVGVGGVVLCRCVCVCVLLICSQALIPFLIHRHWGRRTRLWLWSGLTLPLSPTLPRHTQRRWCSLNSRLLVLNTNINKHILLHTPSGGGRPAAHKTIYLHARASPPPHPGLSTPGGRHVSNK